MSGSDALGLLTMLQHSDSQFPSGGFAFSQGLEASSQLADKLGDFDFSAFLHTQIVHRWAESDRVAIVRSVRLDGDLAELAVLDREAEASTFVEGLRAGSRRNGSALLTTHERLGTPGAAGYRALVRDGTALGHLPVVQGLLWSALGLDEAGAAAVCGYQAAANLATAAVRLGLIGAIQAQAELTRLLPLIAELSRLPVDCGQPIRSFVPLAEIAVALHGSSGQRLFSN